MVPTASLEHALSIDCETEIIADPDEFGAVLGPILAGARARGVADAFELMGVAAVLVDGVGSVLHAGGRAERVLAPFVHVAGGQLVGSDPLTNGLLQSVIAAAIAPPDRQDRPDVVVLRDGAGVDRLRIKAVRFPRDTAAGIQLLQGILIVTECSP